MADEAEITRLQQAVEADPADSETRLALLQLLVEAARWKEAEQAGDVLLQEESPAAAAHALMGIVYSKDRRWDAAVGQCRQALEKQPDDTLVMFNLGTLLVQQGDPQGAIEHLEKVTKLHADWAEAHYALGTALLHRQRYREAINSLDDALDVRPAYPEAEFNRGNAYAMRGLADNGTMDYYELDQAVQAYKKAIQKRPGYPAALYNLGMVYKRMNSSEGLKVWDEYMEAARPLPEETIWWARAQEFKADMQDKLK